MGLAAWATLIVSVVGAVSGLAAIVPSSARKGFIITFAVLLVIAVSLAVAGALRNPSPAIAGSAPTGSQGMSPTASTRPSPSPSPSSSATPTSPLIASSYSGSTGTVTPQVKTVPQTYQNVALEPLCDDGACGGTQQVGNTVFSYTDEAEAADLPDYWNHLAFQLAPTSCSALTVKFSGDIWAQTGTGNPSVVDYLKFVQSSEPTVYATVGVGQIATVHVPLDGGPLYIDASVANDNGIHNSYVLLDITGTCSTPDGTK